MANLSHANNKLSLFPFIPFSILLIAAITEGYNSNYKNKNSNLNLSETVPSHFSKFTRPLPTPSSSVCNDNSIPYKSACESLILSLKTTNPSGISVAKDLFDHSVDFSFNHAGNFVAISKASSFKSMEDCSELQEDSLDQLSNVLNRRKKLSYTKSDIQTWLSAALTNQHTCIESLQNGAFNAKKGEMVSMARNLSQHLSNSLSLYVSHYMNKGGGKGDFNGGRKLLTEDGFPGWLSVSDRKLLETPVSELKAHAVVAKDGSGTHKSIAEALRMVAAVFLDGGSGGGGGRDVITVKAGTYNEYIDIPTKHKNVMLVGEGKDKTVIVGSRSADGGYSTYKSATVAGMGDGFMAKGITFVNSAGPDKHQAVALRVGADKSVIYQCSIQGYQDSLYTHSKRQFYRDTDISGTTDFIFGNSAAVFQNCNIFARASGRNIYITAQGRTDPNQNTGISIHNCKISGGSSKSAYLGRPWQKYSRTVIMQSFLDGSINPAGWSPWSGNFALSTLYYAEYMNSGPGSSTSGRVKWGGYHATLSAAEAGKFTVGNFIDGNMWLPATGVAFDAGLKG
ncbi:probable pectinesterase/pectinesterase inhibitor 35 [Euphorbia lathyris]|uniref:probable pectinesterase/pectinesterase inhibitor 35 n=1 Tax=Euphorbia lathyris TaxID=212925 RepID=UPI0033134B8D